MRHSNRWLAALLLIVALGLAACAGASAAPSKKEKPSKVEAIAGSKVSRVTLTAKAAERLGIQTAQVRDEQVRGAQRKVVPYAAVLYDAQGDTWVYTSPEPLVFVRHPVGVETIEGDRAVLSDGPPSGTVVATVGAIELYGTEFEKGK